MMAEDWLARWEEGRTGWHETDGNAALKKFWPALAPGARVLVPMCGKSVDLLWLANAGFDVTGVELSEIATHAFFEEAGLQYETGEDDGLKWIRSDKPQVRIVCGDYMQFSAEPFDAIYDRASLIAMAPELRPEYVRHTKALLKADALQLLVTLEYEQKKVEGPPFSVLPDEVRRYWSNLKCVASRNDVDGSPPKFRNAGLTEVLESVWLTA